VFESKQEEAAADNVGEQVALLLSFHFLVILDNNNIIDGTTRIVSPLNSRKRERERETTNRVIKKVQLTLKDRKDQESDSRLPDNLINLVTCLSNSSSVIVPCFFHCILEVIID
jgi:hypothetical protein